MRLRKPQTAERRAPKTPGRADNLQDLVVLVFSDVRLVVALGLILTYIWRFHDLAPVLRPFRLAAIFTVLSWGFLALSLNSKALGQALKRPYVIAFLLWAAWIFVGAPLGIHSKSTTDFFFSTESKNVLFFLFLLGTLSSPRRIKVIFLGNVAALDCVARCPRLLL